MDRYRVFVDLTFSVHDDPPSIEAHEDRVLVTLSKKGLRPAAAKLPGGRVRFGISIEANGPGAATTQAAKLVTETVNEVLPELAEELFKNGYRIEGVSHEAVAL